MDPSNYSIHNFQSYRQSKNFTYIVLKFWINPDKPKISRHSYPIRFDPHQNIHFPLYTSQSRYFYPDARTHLKKYLFAIPSADPSQEYSSNFYWTKYRRKRWRASSLVCLVVQTSSTTSATIVENCWSIQYFKRIRFCGYTQFLYKRWPELWCISSSTSNSSSASTLRHTQVKSNRYRFFRGNSVPVFPLANSGKTKQNAPYQIGETYCPVFRPDCAPVLGDEPKAGNLANQPVPAHQRTQSTASSYARLCTD